MKKADAEKRARELLEVVACPIRPTPHPAQLSGGQKQRALPLPAHWQRTPVLLCDEATSALDPNTTHAILTLIKDINKKLGITVVVSSPSDELVEEICDHVAILDGGVGRRKAPCRRSSQTPKRPQQSVWWHLTAAAPHLDLSAFARTTMWCASPSTVRPRQSCWWQAPLPQKKGILVGTQRRYRDLSGQCYGRHTAQAAPH